MQEAEIQQLIKDTIPFSSGLKFSVNKVDGETSHLTFHANEKWTRAGGSISGPFLMTLADAAMYSALLYHGEQHKMRFTSNLNIHFLRRSTSSIFHAVCEIVKLGKRLAVMEVKIEDGEGERISFVSGTYSSGTYSIA